MVIINKNIISIISTLVLTTFLTSQQKIFIKIERYSKIYTKINETNTEDNLIQMLNTRLLLKRAEKKRQYVNEQIIINIQMYGQAERQIKQFTYHFYLLSNQIQKFMSKLWLFSQKKKQKQQKLYFQYKSYKYQDFISFARKSQDNILTVKFLFQFLSSIGLIYLLFYQKNGLFLIKLLIIMLLIIKGDSTSCPPAFYPEDDGNGNTLCNLCSTILSNCSNCNDNKICTSCSSNQNYLDSTSTPGSVLCIPCSSFKPQCTNCKNETYCLTCISNLYYINTIGVGKVECSLCSTAIIGCLNCNTKTYCLICDLKFFRFLSGSLNAKCVFCQSIMPGCIYCTNSSYCTLCDLSYYIKNTGIGSQKCGLCFQELPNCLYCNNTSPFAVSNVLSCTFCATNYVSVINNSIGSCDLCLNLIKGCQLCFQPNLCYSCIVGQFVFVQSQRACIQCSTAIPNCSYCNLSYCSQCQPGFYLLTLIKCSQCSSVLLACDRCNNNTNCNRCIASYYLNNSICHICSKTFRFCHTCNINQCFSCLDNFYLNSMLNCACIKGNLVGNYCIETFGCSIAQLYKQTAICTGCYDEFTFDILNLYCNCIEGRYVSGVCTNLKGCISVLSDPITHSNQFCLMCDITDNFVLQDSQCVCNDGFYPVNGGWDCNEICGDGKVFVLPCDDGNVYSGDGCSSTCQKQEHFTCTNGDANTSTKCLYQGKSINLQLVDIYKVPKSNTGAFVFKISNIVPFINYINFADYIKFDILPQHSKPIAIYSHGKLTVMVDYTQDLEGRPATFTLDFQSRLFVKKINITIPFSMISSTSPLVILNYPSVETLTLLSDLLMIITIFTLIIFIVGSQFHKMIGLQTLHVFQLAYFLPLSVTDSSIVLECFKQLTYSTGFGKQIFFNLEDAQVFGFPFVKFQAGKQFIQSMAVDSGYLLIVIFLVALGIWFVWKTDKKKLSPQLQRMRLIIFHLYHKLVFPIALVFATILLVTTLLNNLQVYQWKTEYLTVTVTSNYNIVFSKVNTVLILIISTLIILVAVIQIFISLGYSHDLSLYEMEKKKGLIKILILHQDNIGAISSYIGFYLLNTLFILILTIIFIFLQSFYSIFCLTVIIIIYSSAIAIIRPYDKCIHNSHLFIIQLTEILVGAGLSVKQYFILTHQKLDLSYEMLWAWIIVGLLITVDLMAIIRIYLLIRVKEYAIDKAHLNQQSKGKGKFPLPIDTQFAVTTPIVKKYVFSSIKDKIKGLRSINEQGISMQQQIIISKNDKMQNLIKKIGK